MARKTIDASHLELAIKQSVYGSAKLNINHAKELLAQIKALPVNPTKQKDK